MSARSMERADALRVTLFSREVRNLASSQSRRACHGA